jgi:hydroxymethylbilane synthase
LRLADGETMACLTAERALVRTLEADCHTPVGAHARRGSGGRLTLEGWVGKVDGSAWVHDVRDGDDPEALGVEVGERLLSAGAGELLRKAAP